MSQGVIEIGPFRLGVQYEYIPADEDGPAEYQLSDLFIYNSSNGNTLDLMGETIPDEDAIVEELNLQGMR